MSANNRASRVYQVVTCTLLFLVCALAAAMLVLRGLSTRPNPFSDLSSFALFLVLVASVATMLAGFASQLIALFFSKRRDLVFAALALLVGASALVVACLWPTGHSLLAAIRANNTAQVHCALRLGVDPNTRQYWGWHHLPGEFALTTASRQGNAEVVRVLLEYGALANPDCDQPPLLSAAQHGHAEIVSMLLAAGASIDRVSSDQTAFSAAACNGHLHVADQLLAAGADPNLGSVGFAATAPDFNRLDYLAKRRENLDECLFVAAQQGNVESVRFLLERGSDPHGRHQSGDTPMQMVEMIIHALEHQAEKRRAASPVLPEEDPMARPEPEWRAEMAPYIEIREMLLEAMPQSPP